MGKPAPRLFDRKGTYELQHKKTRFSHKRKTKPQINCAATAQLISAFVYATLLVQCLFCDCTGRFVSDLVGNHEYQLICVFVIHILKSWFFSGQGSKNFRYEPQHGKTNNLHRRKQRRRSAFAVTAKLLSAFVFATPIVQFFYYLNLKFPASNHLM